MRRLSSLYRNLEEALQALFSRLWSLIVARSPAQGLVEYGLILVLIMVVCVGILTMVGQTTSDVWYNQLLGAMP